MKLKHILAGAMLLVAAATPVQGQESAGDTTRSEPHLKPFSLGVGGYVSSRFDASSTPGVTGFTLHRVVLESEAAYRGRWRWQAEVEYEPTGDTELQRNVSAGANGLVVTRHTSTGKPEVKLEAGWAQFVVTPKLALRAGAVL